MPSQRTRSRALVSALAGTVKKLKPGRHKLAVTYLGNSATNGSKSKVLTPVVTKTPKNN